MVSVLKILTFSNRLFACYSAPTFKYIYLKPVTNVLRIITRGNENKFFLGVVNESI